jgi:ABC-type transport system involved in cytochrome c biogenesis permease subunit
MKRFLVFLILCSPFAGALAASDPDLSGLEQIAIQEGGRKKPYATFCAETLQSISGRRSISIDDSMVTALDAITSIWLRPQSWTDRQILLINYKPLKEKLGLPAAQKLFSFAQLSSNAELQKTITEVRALRARDQHAKTTREQKEVQDVATRLLIFDSLQTGVLFAVVPNPQSSEGRWLTIDDASSAYPAEIVQKVRDAFAKFREAYPGGSVEKTPAAAHELAATLASIKPQFQPPAWKLKLEIFNGKLHPFRWAWIAYLAAAMILCFTSLIARTAGYRLGWFFVLAGCTLQITGFVFRILISGRAPVTNMYESVIWVAFGTILFAIILEAIYRCRYFLLGATPVAVVSLILADTQTAILNSAINPLQPVLRDNFWLSTHVTSITLSYAAFALSLGVGHIILGKIIFGRKASPELYTYLYRAVQIGVLLLATGTILGGVWANYSWGRFWDWDPKETWALIALLGYLVLLHGRIAGSWAGFGLAVGSVIAFQSVLMAWYGVNFVLGAGLHSYGFGTGGFPFVAAFCGAELLYVIVAIVCHRRQRDPLPQPIDRMTLVDV